MQVGDRDVDPDQALELLQAYAVKYADTVRLYDLAGDPDGQPGPGGAAAPVDAVTLGDIGRLVVINARLRAGDVATLMDIDAAAEFAAVPATARLEHCEPRQCSLPGSYGSLREVPPRPGQQHRPRQTIQAAAPQAALAGTHCWDSRVIGVYHRQADSWAATLGIPDGHWEAVREDLTAGTDDFKRLTTRLCDHQEPAVRRLGQLTNLRLLDILAWMISYS